MRESALACAKLHTFPGAGTLSSYKTPHQISRDSSITQMWTLLAWELLCLPRPAWLYPQLPCTLCMHTASGSVVSSLAFGFPAPFLTFVSLPSPSQPGSTAQPGATGPTDFPAPHSPSLLEPKATGTRVVPQCFMGHLVLDALCPKAPQSLHFTWVRKELGSMQSLKCQ